MKILFTYNNKQHDNEFVLVHVRLLTQMGHVVTVSLEEFWEPKQISKQKKM